MSGEIGGGGNGGGVPALEMEIRARAESLANRVGLDFVPGQPFLMLILLMENVMDRVELLEEIEAILKEHKT